MSFGKNRKRSGVILAGVTTASVAASAALQGIVSATSQSKVASNVLKGISETSVKNSNSTVVNFLKNNWGWILLTLGLTTVAGFIFYKIKNQGLKINETKNICLSKNEDENINREQDDMVSLFCEKESGPFAKVMKKPLILLGTYFDKELLGIEGAKIEATVEDLLKILKEGSKEKFKAVVGIGANPKKKIEIKIEAVNEEGNLDVRVENLDLVLETKYVKPDNIDGLISFFNKVLKKVSDDSKKDYRFELKKEYEDNVSIKLIENKIDGKQVESSFAIELKKDEDEELGVKNEEKLNSLILKYQYGVKEINILDELFFESTDGETSYKNNCFNFSKDLEFIGGLELEVSSNTLCRILNDESYGSLPDGALDYLDENENVKISFLPRDRYSLKFMLYNKNVGDFFDCVLETRCADDNVDKFIKFYNYILEEAYKQKKIDFKVSLEKKESKKIVVKHGSREYEFKESKNLMDILREIENDTKNIFAKGVENIISLSFGAGIGKLS